jgi:hypothetical protein
MKSLLLKGNYCKQQFMKKSISVNKKTARGRPRKAGGSYPVTAVRLPQNVLASVDTWATRYGASARSEAIRHLIELGLTVEPQGRPQTKGQKRRASEMAGSTIDELTDTSANVDDRANRKRRLIKGPEEFQNVRVDRPNRKT